MEKSTRVSMLAFLVAGAAFVSLSACAASADDGATASSDLLENAPLCGNGVRDPGEQCDDGNTSNLDGCDASCKFEQVHRINSVQMLFASDSFCSANALGGAIKGVAQGQIQDAVSGAVTTGTISVLLGVNGLADPTGQSGSVSLGSFIGDPVGAVAGVDAKYTVRSSSVGAGGVSLVSLPGTLTSGALAAGPGNVAFAMSFAGNTANISLSNAKAKATVGAATAPAGHDASENLDPALKTFATTAGGQLCGNVSAASLAAVPVPEALAGGTVSCTAGYTTSNSILDVIVGGCKVFFVTALSATQPDKADPSAPVAGAGAPYQFTIGANKKVTGCKDKSGAAQPLAACLKAASYSAGFQFTTQRVAVDGTTAN